MATKIKTILPDYTNFDKGIESITVAKDLQKLQLPEPAKLVSSEKEELQLNKLWKPASLENVLKESLVPIIKDRDELSPTVYQKRLKDAKQTFLDRLKDERERKRKRKPKKFPDEEEEPEEVFEQVINDLEEAERNQDLLWLLKQVVHLA